MGCRRQLSKLKVGDARVPKRRVLLNPVGSSSGSPTQARRWAMVRVLPLEPDKDGGNRFPDLLTCHVYHMTDPGCIPSSYRSADLPNIRCQHSARARVCLGVLKRDAGLRTGPGVDFTLRMLTRGGSRHALPWVWAPTWKIHERLRGFSGRTVQLPMSHCQERRWHNPRCLGSPPEGPCPIGHWQLPGLFAKGFAKNPGEDVSHAREGIACLRGG